MRSRAAIEMRWGQGTFGNAVFPLIAVVLGVSAFLIPPGYKSIAQLALLPAIFCGLSRLSFLGIRIPRWMFFVACSAVLLGTVVRFSHVNLARGAFVVAMGSKNELRKDTKIYRDRVRRALPAPQRALIGVHHETVDSALRAHELLKRYPNLGGVVWGSARWMTISFRSNAPLSLAKFPESSVVASILASRGWNDLKLVTSIPDIGMSHGHQDATVHFIGDIISLSRDFSDALTPGRDVPTFELVALSASRMKARWTSRYHLAVPRWMVGTAYLAQSVANSQVEIGELLCAVRSFKAALEVVRTKDNPSLEAAIRNNYGVSLLLLGEVSSPSARYRKAAAKQFARARRLESASGDIRQVVALNSTIHDLHPKKRRDKNDKK